MVAVSGEELELIARARNEETPELRFLQEREGELYRQYRARVGQIQRSFGERQQEGKRKRKSRWGDKEPEPEPEPELVTPQSREIFPGLALIGWFLPFAVSLRHNNRWKPPILML